MNKVVLSPNDYLKYNQLVSSIPKEWRTRLKTENIILQQNHSMFDKLLKNNNGNRLLYKYQRLNETIPEFKQQAKWKQHISRISKTDSKVFIRYGYTKLKHMYIRLFLILFVYFAPCEP